MDSLQTSRQAESSRGPVYRFADWKADPEPTKRINRRLVASIARAISFAALLELILILLFRRQFLGPNHFFFSVLPCSAQSFLVMIGTIVAQHQKRQYIPTEKELGHLLDIPGPEHQFFAVVTIYTGGQEIGKDRGINTFSGDLIHFEGMKTTFGLPNSTTSWKHGITLPLILDWILASHSGQIRIELDPKELRMFGNQLYAWYVARPELHQNITLPPLNRPTAKTQRATLQFLQIDSKL